METNRLTSLQRGALLAGALATLLAIAMAQCASLSVDNAVRTALILAAAGLSLLCASILVEDALVRPLLTNLRTLGHRLQLLIE
jgi:hypothetical protein